MSTEYKDLYNEALSRYHSNDMENAHIFIQKALAQTQDDPEVWCLEAQIQLAREEWEAADFAVEQALQRASEDFEPHFIQAHLYSASERYEEACEAAQKAITYANTEEQTRDAWQQLAEAYFEMGMTQLKDDAESSMDDDDDEPYILTPELAALFRQGMEAVEKAIELDANLPDAWGLYAGFLEIFNEAEGALQAWRTAVNLAPENPEYLHGLGQALEDLEDDEAHDVFYQLYQLELKLFAQGEEPLLFSPEEFSSTANDIWAEIQHELIDDHVPLVFEFRVAVYPGEELLEESSPESLFDPRVGIHVELLADPFTAMSDDPAPPIVRLHLFQRNIERDLESNDRDELIDVVEELLADCVEQVYDYMESDED